MSDMLQRVCKKCHMTVMHPHPEKPKDYYKCPTCGYCEERSKEKEEKLKDRQKNGFKD
jgi:hypothetical protein